MLQYVQVERQIHIDFTDDVLLVMQARSDGNDDEKIVESSLGLYSFLSGLFFHAISCIPVFQETSRPDVKASCKELPAEKRRTLFEAGKEGETSYGLQQGSPGHY